MIRVIHYNPKITSARTQYVDISSDDMAWLKLEMCRWLSQMAALDNYNNRDIKFVMKNWWYKRTSTLPKSRDGLNSPLSFVGGMINNLLFGTQHDLSQIQMDALENISAQMAMFDEAIAELQLTNNTPTSFKFQINLLQIVPNK